MALAVIAVIVYWVVHSLAGASHPVNNAAHGQPVRHASASATPSHSLTATGVAKPRRNVVVQLAANEACWVGVYAADGAQEWQQVIPAGTTRSWTFTRQVSMEIGNPGGVALTVNGRSINSLGSQPVTLDLKPGHKISG